MKAFAAGWGILVLAVILNLAASRMGIVTWYEYLQEIPSAGLASATMRLKIIDFAFLFLFYPFSLGFVAVLIAKHFS